MGDPPLGDLGGPGAKDSRVWEFQKVTDLRKGPANLLFGETGHYWPVNISSPLQPADPLSAKLADLLLLPENSQKPIPKSSLEPMVRHASACLISGGGTPQERGQAKPSTLSQAVYQAKTKKNWAPGPNDTGQGHWWD